MKSKDRIITIEVKSWTQMQALTEDLEIKAQQIKDYYACKEKRNITIGDNQYKRTCS